MISPSASADVGPIDPATRQRQVRFEPLNIHVISLRVNDEPFVQLKFISAITTSHPCIYNHFILGDPSFEPPFHQQRLAHNGFLEIRDLSHLGSYLQFLSVDHLACEYYVGVLSSMPHVLCANACKACVRANPRATSMYNREMPLLIGHVNTPRPHPARARWGARWSSPLAYRE